MYVRFLICERFVSNSPSKVANTAHNTVNKNKVTYPMARYTVHPQTITPLPPCSIVPWRFSGVNFWFLFLYTICRPSNPEMLNLLSSAKITFVQFSCGFQVHSRANARRFSRFNSFMNGFFRDIQP